MKMLKENFYDLLPIIVNPIIVSKLDSNLDAVLFLQILYRFRDSEDEEGFNILYRKDISEYTGLSENQIKKSETYLKKINILKTKIRGQLRYYKIDYIKYFEIIGVSIYPSLVSKLKNNSKAALLLLSLLDINISNESDLFFKIPSLEVKLSIGLDRKSQIYARDTLLSFKLLNTSISNKVKVYSINQKLLRDFLKQA